ncbi:hypothetical protein HETIRDRAFT_118988 [Heterobasidion irregulare TC 32-1]|uniref:Uncharacterized protein n=1 Tax=Heterobasidion irregulare (strain TC 32-1) TaxID=747525 RepID=W4JTH9_HETIT|nr:uncharacterized protein HETIRDRAFT_118988 [Heterobasidion irregulare TC 32-1]ETW76857.1 hypothetical protein HETIRDRAFT_118988 [Heterobasidion irregulare TC 32-1]
MATVRERFRTRPSSAVPVSSIQPRAERLLRARGPVASSCGISKTALDPSVAELVLHALCGAPRASPRPHIKKPPSASGPTVFRISPRLRSSREIAGSWLHPRVGFERRTSTLTELDSVSRSRAVGRVPRGELNGLHKRCTSAGADARIQTRCPRVDTYDDSKETSRKHIACSASGRASNVRGGAGHERDAAEAEASEVRRVNGPTSTAQCEMPPAWTASLMHVSHAMGKHLFLGSFLIEQAEAPRFRELVQELGGNPVLHTAVFRLPPPHALLCSFRNGRIRDLVKQESVPPDLRYGALRTGPRVLVSTVHFWDLADGLRIRSQPCRFQLLDDCIPWRHVSFGIVAARRGRSVLVSTLAGVAPSSEIIDKCRSTDLKVQWRRRTSRSGCRNSTQLNSASVETTNVRHVIEQVVTAKVPSAYAVLELGGLAIVERRYRHEMVKTSVRLFKIAMVDVEVHGDPKCVLWNLRFVWTTMAYSVRVLSSVSISQSDRQHIELAITVKG